MQCLLTPPTPVTQDNPTPAFVDLPPRRSYDSDSESSDMPLPSPIKFQSKWIHRRLWAREDQSGDSRRNSLLGTVVPRSWSKDRAGRNTSEKSTVNRFAAVEQPALARSSSISPSIASSMGSSRAAAKPTKSALSSRASISTKASRITRAGSGSAPSVKFADAPTYYHDYEYQYHAHGHPPISEYDAEFHSPLPSPAASPTVPCANPSPRHSVITAPATCGNKVRKALKRLLPTTPRHSTTRSSTISISGPYPLWKDNDGASIRSGRSIPSSVQSAPASRSKVNTFWGRMMARTM